MAQRWFNQLEYIYWDIKKDIFIDGHKRPNVIKDWKVFLKTISDLKLYLFKFSSKKNIKEKIYPDNCQVGVENHWLMIVIKYDEYIFSAKDGQSHRWQCKGDTFLCPKKKKEGLWFLISFYLFFALFTIPSWSRIRSSYWTFWSFK